MVGRSAFWLSLTVAVWGSWGCASGQGLLQRFLPVEKVDARSDQSYRLTEQDGPWLIMAATFSGEGAEDQAHALVIELRRRFNLPAYLHDRTYDYSAQVGGRGLDDYGVPIRRRLQQRGELREWAVLVGDFETIDDPRGQDILDRIKELKPDALRAEGGKQSAQSLSEVRQFHNALLARLGKQERRGPMCKAFFTPNPLMPPEYFNPRGVDKFVADMNEGVEHSLLDAPNKFTVQVATFRGSSVIQTSATSDGEGFFGKRRQSRGDSLVEAAENAHLLTQQLREHGVQAYEFHNRTESIVTIGSFDQAMRQSPDGRIVPTPDVQRVIETFGAAYNTPSDPLNGDDPINRQRRDKAALELTAGVNHQSVELATGLNPKHVKILRGKKLLRTIPMDVHPRVIEAPKRSISAAYLR